MKTYEVSSYLKHVMRRYLNNCGICNIFVRTPVTICDNDSVFPKLIQRFILKNFIFFVF